jgi:hypothetical protein
MQTAAGLSASGGETVILRRENNNIDRKLHPCKGVTINEPFYQPYSSRQHAAHRSLFWRQP